MAGHRIEPESRTERVCARVSPSTLAALEQIESQHGINVAALLAGVGLIHERGDVAARYALKSILDSVPRPEKQAP